MAEQALLADEQSPQASEAATGLALVVERLALNPTVDVAKLEKIIELQERIMRHNAKAAFDAAFSKMQPEIPQIDEHGRVIVKGQLRSTYATLEDIHEVVKPIIARHGFAMRHRTEWPVDKPKIIRIVGILSHEQGHAEESSFEAPSDASDFRSDIQSMGSTVSYGRRYTTLDLLNIATKKADNDGQKPTAEVKAPTGFEDWWLDMLAVAGEGTDKLAAAWRSSKQEYQRHVMATNRNGWNALKAQAAKVTA